MHHNDNTPHIPVLVREVLEYLTPASGETYLDLTAGYGGHAREVLERTGNYQQAVLVDRDAEAIKALSKAFAGKAVQIEQGDFLSVAKQLKKGGRQFDLILADLGVSSPHLDNAGRGFALSGEGPLDMRMDTRQTLTAETIVNTYPEAELAAILATYGEEPKAKKIARLITENRPIHTTTSLASIVSRVWPRHQSKVHPATRTFQALRIAVNDELRLLEAALPIWIDLLAPGGRIGVISFHSLEDRIVKQAFREQAGDRYDAMLRILTRQPVIATDSEIVSNPRARSAKLRAAAKIKIQRERSSDADPGQK